jgi:hypothetical protein
MALNELFCRVERKQVDGSPVLCRTDVGHLLMYSKWIANALDRLDSHILEIFGLTSSSVTKFGFKQSERGLLLALKPKQQ